MQCSYLHTSLWVVHKHPVFWLPRRTCSKMRCLSSLGEELCHMWVFARCVCIVYYASITLSLDLCPPASPEFTGPWNGNASFPHGNHPKIKSISYFSSFFLNVKGNLPHLNFDFSTLKPSKIDKICCEMRNRNETCLPHQTPQEIWTQIWDLNSKNCASLMYVSQYVL